MVGLILAVIGILGALASFIVCALSMIGFNHKTFVYGMIGMAVSGFSLFAGLMLGGWELAQRFL
jgi:hypothetical protein